VAGTIRDLIVGFKFTVDMAPVNRLANALKNVKTTAAEAGGGLAGMAAGFKSVGGAMSSLGRELSLKVSAPLAALGGLAAKSAIEFESAFAGVRKTVDATGPQLEAIRAGIRRMATETPFAATEIAKVAENAGQLGIKSKDILAFSKTMLELGTATNLTADEAATSLAQFINITGLSADKIQNLGSSLVYLGNNGASTEKQIMDMGLRIASAGHMAGITDARIMGIANALASMGMEAEAGGTAVSQLLNRMSIAVSKGGKGLNAFAAAAGMTGDAFRRSFKADAANAILQLVTGLNKASKAGKDINLTLADLDLTDIRLSDAVRRLSNGHGLLAQSLKDGDTAFAANNALSKEAGERYKTLASKLAVMKNRITELGMVIGEDLMPYIERASEIIKALTARLSAMDPSTRKLAVGFGLIVTALGPMLWILGSIAQSIGAIMGLFTTFGAAAVLSTGGVVLAIGAVLLALGDLALFLATGDSMFASFWSPWVDWIDRARTGLADLTEAIPYYFSAGFEGASAAVSEWMNMIVGTVQTAINTIHNIVAAEFNLAVELFNKLPGVNQGPSGAAMATFREPGSTSNTANQTNHITINGARNPAQTARAAVPAPLRPAAASR
jgi:TP901 family phage tail tape measure protein